MAFFITKIDKQSVADSTGGNYISENGIYDVTIKFVSVKVNEHGARSLDFNVDYKGSEQVFYGLKLDNNDGTENFQRNVFNKLCVILGIESVDNPTIETHKVGKDQTPTDLSVLTEFSDMPVKLRVHYLYELYNGDIKEKREIKAFYRASDSATAAEILAASEGEEVNFGTQLEKDLGFINEPTYKDGLNKETVDAWKADKKASKGTAPKGKTPPAPKNNIFQPKPFPGK